MNKFIVWKYISISLWFSLARSCLFLWESLLKLEWVHLHSHFFLSQWRVTERWPMDRLARALVLVFLSLDQEVQPFGLLVGFTTYLCLEWVFSCDLGIVLQVRRVLKCVLTQDSVFFVLRWVTPCVRQDVKIQLLTSHHPLPLPRISIYSFSKMPNDWMWQEKKMRQKKGLVFG